MSQAGTRGREVDVAIVGAGFAGLAAAAELRRLGARSVILEARDRVGGRVHTIEAADGTPIDIGGQWIGPTQERMYALVREHGMETYPTPGGGLKNVLRLAGRNHRYRGTIPIVMRPLMLANVGWMLVRLNQLARKIPLQAPWSAPRARAWDAITLEDWLRRNVPSKHARTLATIGLETVLACDPCEVSFLHALFYIRSAGNLDLLLDTEGGAQQDRIVGGVEPLADRMCEALGEGAVELGAPVRRIEQHEEGVRVLADGVQSLQVDAARVIVTVPPPLAARIEYDPVLPASRDQLTQRVFMGSAMKCIALYDRPFWRDAGLSGEAIIDEGPIRAVFDASQPDGDAPDTSSVLLGFAEGSAARELASKPLDERRRIALEAFAKCLGDAALQARDYIDRFWAEEPWSRGCYTGVFPPGVWTSHGHALRTPCGRIHWAGTETAEVWTGYIEGAVRSGERAAREVLAAR